jgi:negative regulator of replication initiation
MKTSEEKDRNAMLRSAQGIINSASEIARAVRNLDTTIKAANAAAKDIKIAGIAVSVAIGVLSLVQIVLQLAGD